MTKQLLARIGSKLVPLALMLGGATLAASAAAPKATGSNFAEGSVLFPGTCDTIKVHYDAPVLSASYELYQNGVKVMEGTDNGQSQNQPVSIFDLSGVKGNSTNNNNLMSRAIIAGTLKPGPVEFKVTKVEYFEGDEEATATEVASFTWNLTDQPEIIGISPMWHPNKALKEIKVNTSVSFNAGMNFGSVINPETNKAVYTKNQVKGGKLALLEDGVVKNVVILEKPVPSTGVYNQSLAFKLTADDLEPLRGGEVELRLVEYNYIAPDGTEKTAKDELGVLLPYKSGDYQILPGRAMLKATYAGVAPQLVSESVPEQTTELLSYYSKDGEDGVITYTFNKPIKDTGFNVVFRIGDANHDFDQIVPYTFSDDKKSIIADLRGLANGADALSNGYVFKDDDGKVYEPSLVTILIENLWSESGQKVVTSYTPPGSNTRTLEGMLYRSYKYKDISYKTPVLSDAVFYNSADADNKTTTIEANSDMMQVNVSNTATVESADVVYLTESATLATIPSAQVTRNEGVWSVALPEAVRTHGMRGLLVGLANVTYSYVDGNTHVVAPLDLTAQAPLPKVTSVAEIKALEEGTEFDFVTEGLNVTMASSSLTVVEDKSGAIQVMANDEKAVFDLNTVVTGTVKATYLGQNMIQVNVAESAFTATEAEIPGYEVTNFEDCTLPANAFRLLSFSEADGFTISYDADAEVVLINGTLPVMDATGCLPEDYKYPAAIDQVTGVLYTVDTQTMLFIRSASDIVAGVPALSNLSEVNSLNPGDAVKVNVAGAKVTHNMAGGFFLQDYTAAVMVMADPETPIEGVATGKALTGTLYGTYYGNGIISADPAKCSFTTADVDVTEGKIITAADVTNPLYRYVLVKLVATEDAPIAFNDQMEVVMAGSNVIVDTQMGDFADDYEFPAQIASVTGILYPLAAVGLEDAGEQAVAAQLMLRSAADVEAVPAPTYTEVNGIAAVVALPEMTEVKVNLKDAVVTYTLDGRRKQFYIEDESGAIAVGCESPIAQGKKVNGYLIGTYFGMGILFIEPEQMDQSEFTASEDVDVSKGAEILYEDAFKMENNNRLVTFKNTDENPFTTVDDPDYGEGVKIGDAIFASAMFDEEGYTYPQNIASLTGILYISEAYDEYDDAAETETPAVDVQLLLRSADDVASDQSAISSVAVKGRTTGDVYNVKGVKVANAGSSLRSLAPGVYMINGQKVLKLK